MKPIRILLVDDHILFRKGLAGILGSNPDLQVVGEAGDGIEALEKTTELMPDVILMDINMPRSNGLEATRKILQQFPYVRIVILTVSDAEDDLFEAIKSGARGYLLKNLEPADLFAMIVSVAQGEAAISPSMASKILNEFARSQSPKPAPVYTRQPLTDRERQVLQLVAKGDSNKEIANALSISESTVRNHLHNILEKLHLENRVQAAIYAFREKDLLDS